MPAGLPYFAWVDADEVVFLPGHMRWDESIFSFELKQDEGDPASLTAVVRRPRNEAGDPIGLLGPGRKIWCWFALDCGAAELLKFRGRLVGIPTSIFEELVTLEFVARPRDAVAQKRALAATLRVLPYYDEVMIDKARRDDPEVVLEGYTANWHYDRETHLLTISDELVGEDGLVEFDGASEAGKIMWDGLGLTLAEGPLSQVDVKAEFTWTQRANGQVDLTDYLISNWPNDEYAWPGEITSYSLTADNWPTNGAGIGDGWEVKEATARAVYDLEVKTKTQGSTIEVKWPDGGTTSSTVNESTDSIFTPPGSIPYAAITTKNNGKTVYGKGEDSFFGPLIVWTSYSHNFSKVESVLPMHHSIVTLIAGYAAERQFTEQVEFSLVADVQAILTDPDESTDGEEEGASLIIDDLRSVNLSAPIDEEIGTASGIPLDDPRRRSYIATERGNRSLEYCIAVARAHLMKRARAVEITFVPKLARMPEITLRKNVSLIDPRVGEAVGKVISYSVGLDGGDGQVKCEVRIGCAIGRGGSISPEDGSPLYCTVDYCGHDYQQFTGRTIVVFDSSVGYQPPASDPNDDGVEFLSVLRAEDVIQIPLAVENPPAVQREHILGNVIWPTRHGITPRNQEDVERQADETVKARAEAVTNALKEVETKATFKLKSMTREFSTPYELEVTELKIPTGYDLSTT